MFLLSPVPVFPSDPSLIPLIYSYHSYPVVSSFCISFYTKSVLPLRSPSSTQTLHSPLSTPNLHSSLNSESALPWFPLLSEPLVFKPRVSFDTKQSDHFILLCIFCILLRVLTLTWTPSQTSVQLPSDPLSDLRPTRVSDNYSKMIGHTHILYKWVQHISWSQVLPITPSDYLLTNSDLTPSLFQPHSRSDS